MKIHPFVLSLLLLLVMLWGCSSEDNQETGNEEYDPVIDPANFVSGVNNEYFPLLPGRAMHYLSTTIESGDTTTENVDVITTSGTKVIMGVTCVVVHDVVTAEADTLEDTWDWFAQDAEGNVWYFGEDTRAWNGSAWITEGSWEAGVDGALPGIVMQGEPQDHIGVAYRQEYYPGQAEDQTMVLSVNDTVTVSYGFFDSCVKTKDWTDLSPGVVENKYFAPDTGNVLTIKISGGNEREELIGITD